MLGGAGNKPDSIQNYTMIILIADQYIQGEKLGWSSALILLEWNGW